MKAGTINELLDMLTFALAVEGMQSLVQLQQGSDKNAQAHLLKGVKLGKMIHSKKSFAVTLSENWSLIEKEGGKITGAKRSYGKATGGLAFDKLIVFYSSFTIKFLSSNQRSPLSLADLFTLQAQWRMVKNIAKELEDAGDDLGALSDVLGKFSLLMNGKGKATKKLVLWAKKCADFGSLADSLSDEVDKAEREITAGDNLGKAKREFDSTDNEDPEARLNAEMNLAEAERNAEEVINESDDPKSAKSRIVSQAVKAQKDLGFGVSKTGYAYKTAVGAKYELNDEQEAMLTSSGKVVMAAGAGSGKTHTLTALIEYMCSSKREGGRGIRPNQIMVSSFTVAASGEILERVTTKSNVRMPKRPKGFGTVHSLTAKNISEKNKRNAISVKERPKRCKYVGKDEGYYIDQIMLIALRQVAMRGGGLAPKPTNLFTGAEIEFNPEDAEKGLKEMLNTQESLEVKGVKMTADILDKLKASFDYFGSSVDQHEGIYTGRGWKTPNARFYPAERKNHDVLEDLLNPTFIEKTGWGKTTRYKFSYSPKYDVGDEVSSEDVDKINGVFSTLPGFPPYRDWKKIRIASGGVKVATNNTQKKEPINYFRKEEVKWWDTPARKWWNIGIDIAKLEKMFGGSGEEAKEGGKKKGDTDEDDQKNLMKVLGKSSRLIALLKGKGISPTEAWYKVGDASEVNQIEQFDPYVAVYAAYEWLLGNTDQIPRDGDMTDIIIDSIRVLCRDPSVLADLQQQYKLILVDEAQDLNRVQHLFFGLIAGTIDPQTLEEKPASDMSATMYAMIGDDKQAIYGFQGADSKEMISKADVMGGDFKTNLITTNYRSGKNIVDMANQFIAYNEDQIPMVCKANVPKNGMGEVELHETLGNGPQGAQVKGAEKVMEIMLETKSQKEMNWKDFGIGVRTNAEGELYALMCLKNNIPFKGRYNPLKKKEYKGILAYFKLAKYLISGAVANADQVLFDITRYPKSFINKKMFMDYFSAKADPIKALLNAEYQKEASFYFTSRGKKVSALGKRVDDLQQFVVRFTKYLKGLKGPVTSRAIQDFLFGTKDGDPTAEPPIPPSILPAKRNGKTILESIKDEIMGSVSELNKIQAPGGDVTEEMIEQAALEKFGAFSFLVKTGDELVSNEDDGTSSVVQGTVFDLIDFTNQIEGIGEGGENSDGNNTDKDDKNLDAVRIMTCHGWKGLEVDTMFVPCGMMWPRSDTTTPMKKEEIIEYVKNHPPKDREGNPVDKKKLLRNLLVSRDEMESERRLMYVAMTRAEQTLHLIHTEADLGKKHGIVGSHFFRSREICINPSQSQKQPTGKFSSVLQREWGDYILD